MNLKGNLKKNNKEIKKDYISCLLCTARGPEVLKGLLVDLSKQILNKDQFEVIILDNSLSGLEDLMEQFSKLGSVRYIHESSTQIMMGALRNKTIEVSQGEYLLFLDDDTRIPQENFLEESLSLFKKTDADVIMPYGKALKSNDTYNYLDPFSYAARCCFYKRSILEKVGGFFDELAAYEDIDLGIRSNLSGVKVLKTDQLKYEHPRFFFRSLQKPIAIGQAIFQLQKYYPWYLWLLIYFNALRFLPLVFFPTMRNRQWFKISWGVLISPFIQKKYTYRV